MRSRYDAHVGNDVDYLRATWHPDTVPDELVSDATLEWVGLEIVRTERGGALDADGVVEFKAHFVRNGEPGVLHEISRFTRDGMRWLYVDGVHPL